MKKAIFLSAILVFCLSQINSQNIDFKPGVKLFDHPVDGLFDFALIPLDFDNDGDTDYIGRTGDSQVEIYLNDKELYEPTGNLAIEPYARPFDILDFDNNGSEDIVMESYIFLKNATTGLYTVLDPEPIEDSYPSIVGVADFDGNGFNDLLVTYGVSSNPSGLSIYYYDGIDFEKKPFEYSDGVGPVSFGDIDGDGDQDIAYVNKFEEDTPALLINDGLGNFETRLVQSPAILKNRTLELEDFDLDGDLDILASDFNNAYHILINDDNYISAPNKYVVDMNNVIFNKTADLNNDGKSEIVTLELVANGFSLYVYELSTSFNSVTKTILDNLESPTTFITLNPNYTNNTIRIRDVENDGDQDIILSFSLGDDPSVLLYTNKYIEYVLSNENIEEQSLLIYPNPTSNILQFKDFDQLNDYLYEIYNLLGQVVQRGTIDQSIGIESLLQNEYILKVNTGDEVLSSKFVKI